MQRLCDEVLQLIFYELIDPTPLTLVSKRFHRFSQDPYVRANYFLVRYGPIEAMFHALGRPKIIDKQVLDILLSSGAHLSRYLIQVSMHHYFYTQSHFIKTPWVRNLPLRVFTYFLQRAEERYGEIPRGKSEDDGYVFSTFLKESRLPTQAKSVSWETIRELLERYNDPIMAQFPIALAIEPRLLSYAVENGFCMDTKYRDFVFRKMFEKPISADETLAGDIIHNVRELCRLDPTMFVSRTVAAEVCMEAKTNNAGYAALKQLDESGDLRFELSRLVEDLIKSFIASRLISHGPTTEVLRYLFTDFPSSDSTVRLVMLIAIFILPDNLHHSPASLHAQLQVLGLTPVTKKDVVDILLNPFVERFQPLLDYAKREVGEQEDGTKGMGRKELATLVEDVAGKCLEISCKGKLLRKFYDGFPGLLDSLADMVVETHQLKLEDIPSWEEGDKCKRYEAKLCRELPCGLPYEGNEVEVERRGDGKERNSEFDGMKRSKNATTLDLVCAFDNIIQGGISQESLSTMIRRDEVTPVRSRRRMYFPHNSHNGDSNKLYYPLDPLHVGRWVKSYFGLMSSVTAIFMTHAIINDNSNMLHHYIYSDSNQLSSTTIHVPITLKHFQILARLGRAPSFFLYHDIEAGAEFFFDENDYILNDTGKKPRAIKTEVTSTSFSTSRSRTKSDASSLLSSRGRKRPRRAATTIRSYVVPDSDDDMLDDDEPMEFTAQEHEKRTKTEESSLQKWVKHLGNLVKEEQRKYQKHKKLVEMTSEPGMKVRVAKTDFLRSLSSRMRNLRKAEQQQRAMLYGPSIPTDEYSDDDDDEYRARTKRTTRAS
ncbi:hypothetical protein L208DRAFT_1423428 [Tricholoma matsutake]|nr:hypothetical protein L208DRAFT_1423428 [Tricholoma matsutake 945]